MSGLWSGLAALVCATLFGLLWQRRQGRIRSGTGGGGAGSNPAAPGLPEPVLRQVDPAAAVTLLQLNTPVCARCPRARAVLGDVAASTAGVRHAELDLVRYPELAGQLGVRSTPTTLVLSGTGHELFRVTGVPRRADLLAALQPHLGEPPEPASEI